jgi:peptidoglycan-N-acetylglucosamine deacetylase
MLVNYSHIYNKSTFKIIVTVLVFLILASYGLTAQENIVSSKKCIVSLTYDDGLDIDLDNVIPVLDSLGFEATFYVPCNSPSLNNRMDEWRAIAKNGHELGNHTLFHPCFGKSMKRDWVVADYDLDIYSMQRMVDEIKLANAFLKAIDGKTKRTFAYTCGDQKIGDENIWDKIKDDFIAGRGVNKELPQIDEVNLSNIGSYMAMGQTGDEMISWVKEAMAKKSLIVFLFHGVGGGHNINVDLKEHSKLLHFLKENKKDIWVAPLVEIAEYVKNNQKEKK